MRRVDAKTRENRSYGPAKRRGFFVARDKFLMQSVTVEASVVLSAECDAYPHARLKPT